LPRRAARRCYLAEARRRSLTLSGVEEFESVTGLAVHRCVDGHTLVLGSTVLMQEVGADVEMPSARTTLVKGELRGIASGRGRAGVLLSPMFAALARSLSSVSVVANAPRLRGVSLRSA
jgi:cation transport ATPase